jgi:hypothetical protein
MTQQRTHGSWGGLGRLAAAPPGQVWVLEIH